MSLDYEAAMHRTLCTADRSLSLLFLLSVAGCEEVSIDLDAGVSPRPLDAGVGVDAGAPDGHVDLDAGVSPRPLDAGVGVDAGAPDGSVPDPCAAPGLVWRSGNKTNYDSYPAPGSEECVRYNGCTWAGQFAACDGKKSEAWVSAHAIASVFPTSLGLSLHDLCLRSGDNTLVVTVYDTCSDSDCSGCCTANKGRADALIDLESSTDVRWGLDDGPLEWADLGPTRGTGCD